MKPLVVVPESWVGGRSDVMADGGDTWLSVATSLGMVPVAVLGIGLRHPEYGIAMILAWAGMGVPLLMTWSSEDGLVKLEPLADISGGEGGGRRCGEKVPGWIIR